MKKKKKYYYLSFDSFGWMLLGIVVTVGSLVLGWLTEGDNWIWILSMLLFLLGIATIIIPPIIINGKEIKKAYQNGLLEEAISDAIEASKQTQDKTWYTRKYEHFLHEITQADKLNPIDLNIDDPKFDNLFTLNGALSITNAPLFAWKDPEYSWFLIANYTATLNKRYSQGNNVFQLKNRKDKEFDTFLDDGDKILESIAKGAFSYDSNVRFYILSEEEIKENKAMIEQMIAGHELFGIHLFIINANVFEDTHNNVKIDRLYQTLLESSNISNDVFDVMIFKSNSNMRFKYPSEGQLKERDYSDIENNCNPFIQALACKLSNNSSYRIYPRKGQTKIDIGTIQIDLNSNYTFVSV